MADAVTAASAAAAAADTAIRTVWSLKAYCALEQARVARLDLSQLSVSSQQFLQHLNLSYVHPFCANIINNNDATLSSSSSSSSLLWSFPTPNVPPMGPLIANEEFSWWEQLWHVWYHTAPPLLAMAELWLRLLASVLAPLCIAHLLWTYINKHATMTMTMNRKSMDDTVNGINHNNSDNHQHDDDSPSKGSSTKKDIQNHNNNDAKMFALVSILGVAASVVLVTDTLYVLEFGPQYGMACLVLTTLLTLLVGGFVVVPPTLPSPKQLPRSSSLPVKTRNTVGMAVVLLWGLTIHLLLRHHYDASFTSFQKGATSATTTTKRRRPSLWFSFGDAHDQVLIPEGLYYDTTHPTAQKIAQQFSPRHYSYTKESGATSWMPTGDARTGLPFLLNHGKTPAPSWIRVWLPVASAPAVLHNDDDNNVDDDGGDEYVALDIAFPTDEIGFDPTQPLYLILHGLNGGSQEEFVMDFANRRLGQYNNRGGGGSSSDGDREHATVVVMVARGLMDLPIRGWNVFHGARVSDVHTAALALDRVLQQQQQLTTSSHHQQRKQRRPGFLAAVGFSMGGIILSNYVARYGSECPLQAAVAISGGLDMRQVITLYRAQRLWQPMITTTLRHEFVIDKWGQRVRARLTKDQLRRMMQSTHITEIDEYAVVAYNNGFDNLTHYYSEMSALGDIPIADYTNETLLSTNRVGVGARIRNISIPLLVVHAMDDPLITWRTVAAMTAFYTPPI